MGFPVDNIGKPGHCTGCGRGPTDDVRASIVHGEWTCDWCLHREARTQGALTIYNNLVHARRALFPATSSWRYLNQGQCMDGGAWMNDALQLKVIESVALENDLMDDFQRPGRSRSDKERLAMRPVVEASEEHGLALVVRSLAGVEFYRYPLVSVTDVAEHAKAAEAALDAIMTFHRNMGWEWWHHVSVSRYDGQVPEWRQLVYVKEQFITKARYAYQVFPPAEHYVNRAQVLHLWASLELKHGIAGGVLPVFDGLLPTDGKRTI